MNNVQSVIQKKPPTMKANALLNLYCQVNKDWTKAPVEARLATSLLTRSMFLCKSYNNKKSVFNAFTGKRITLPPPKRNQSEERTITALLVSYYYIY